MSQWLHVGGANSEMYLDNGSTNILTKSQVSFLGIFVFMILGLHTNLNLRTLPEAMEDCDQQRGRLIATKNCDELDNVRQALIDLEYGLGAEFFIGTFAFNLQSANERRRSKTSEDQINSYVSLYKCDHDRIKQDNSL